MASKFSLILCIFAIWAIDSASSSHNAPSPSPSPSVDCMSIVTSLIDCLSFVQNGSTITKPEKGCCSGLKTIIQTAPACLCEGFKHSAQLGLDLNLTKALTLPSACKLTAPSLSNCGLSDTPAAAPGLSLSPGSSPSSVTTPLSTEPATAPSGKSAASALVPISATSLLVCLLSLFSGL